MDAHNCHGSRWLPKIMKFQDIVLAMISGRPIADGQIVIAEHPAVIPAHRHLLVDFAYNPWERRFGGLALHAVAPPGHAEDGFYMTRSVGPSIYIAAVNMVLIDQLLSGWPRDEVGLHFLGRRIGTLIYVAPPNNADRCITRQAIDEVEFVLSPVASGLLLHVSGILGTIASGLGSLPEGTKFEANATLPWATLLLMGSELARRRTKTVPDPGAPEGMVKPVSRRGGAGLEGLLLDFSSGTPFVPGRAWVLHNTNPLAPSLVDIAASFLRFDLTEGSLAISSANLEFLDNGFVRDTADAALSFVFDGLGKRMLDDALDGATRIHRSMSGDMIGHLSHLRGSAAQANDGHIVQPITTLDVKLTLDLDGLTLDLNGKLGTVEPTTWGWLGKDVAARERYERLNGSPFDIILSVPWALFRAGHFRFTNRFRKSIAGEAELRHGWRCA